MTDENPKTTPTAAPDISPPTSTPAATEDVSIPVEVTPSPTKLSIDEDNGSKDLSSKWFAFGLVMSIFFGLFGFIGYCFIPDERKKRAYLKGCFIGIVISIVFDIIAIILLILWYKGIIGSRKV